MATQPEYDITLCLLRFTRGCATHFSSGIDIVSTLTVLADELPAPFSEVLPALLQRLSAQETISQAMARWEDLFPSSYRTVIRLGEISGSLEVSMRYLAEALEEELLLQRISAPVRLIFTDPRTQSWAALDDMARRVVLRHFSQGFALALSAGVPTGLALRTAAELLPVAEAQAVTAVAAQGELSAGVAQPLASLRIFPQTFHNFLEVGESIGALDFTLDKAAQFYHDDLRYLSGLVTATALPQGTTLAHDYHDRLERGPIPSESADAEYRFFADALAQAGLPQPPPAQSARQRMRDLTRMLLRYAHHLGADTVQLRGNDLQLRLCINSEWQDIRCVPNWLFDMLNYHLRSMANLDTAHLYHPAAGDILLDTIGTAHFTFHAIGNGGMIEVRFAEERK
jgi:hypothetical protein